VSHFIYMGNAALKERVAPVERLFNRTTYFVQCLHCLCMG